MTQLTVSTTIVRQSEAGPVECDVVVTYEGRVTSPFVPQTYWQPAEGPEIEAEFVSAEFDGGPPDDVPGSLTEAEIEALKSWLHGEGGWRKVFDDVVSAAADDGPDPDAARDRAIEDRMFRQQAGTEGEEF